MEELSSVLNARCSTATQLVHELAADSDIAASFSTTRISGTPLEPCGDTNENGHVEVPRRPVRGLSSSEEICLDPSVEIDDQANHSSPDALAFALKLDSLLGARHA